MNSLTDEWEAIKSGLFWLFSALIGSALAFGMAYFVYAHWKELLPLFAMLTIWVVILIAKWDGK